MQYLWDIVGHISCSWPRTCIL